MARNLQQIDVDLRQVEANVQALASEKPLDKIADLQKKTDDLERMLYEMKNVTLEGLNKAFQDSADSVKQISQLTSALDEKA